MRKTKTLLGISLFGVLLLSLGVILTKSGITQAQQSFTKKNIMYTGIDSNAETLYELRFQDLTPMGIFNNNIFRTSEVSVVVNGENKSNQSEIDTSRNRVIDSNNSNILGGDLLRIERSDGITVIGGEGGDDNSVEANNSYATFLGGFKNRLFENGENNQTPVVLLGGEVNTMSPNHTASAIVGGENNQIHDNARNVNILGGKDVIVEGDRSNIIIGGENVTIGEVDDVFAFSDGSDGKNFHPNMGGAFYLNVQNGVGFGTGASGSGGVVSNGAVSLGGNIDDIECNEENIGIQGTWSGCLVGCTQAAANVTDTDWDPWELLDHGPSCAEKCKSSDKCMQLEEKEPEGIESYTAFCTQGLVYTGNSTICPSNGEYQDVIFETNLIDSEADCPNPDSYNQCVYKCNADTHLTGDVTGKFSGITMCFHDCRLPWDAEGNLPKKKHNERIIAYDVADAYCSNDAGKKDTCLSHKHELICVDGGWYTTNNNHKAASENTKYVKEKCTLNRYERCKDIGYDLERKNIINEKEDIMQFWGYGGGNQNFVNYLTRYLLNGEYIPYQYNPNSYDQFHAWRQDEPKQGDRKSVNGVRGIYEQCIDYVPNTQAGVNTDVAPDNESCKEKEPLPAQYHYKFIKCRDGYDKDSFGVCRKRCTFGTKTIEHNEPITLYTGSSATCTDICHAETFRCYDGTLYQESTLQIDAKGKLISGVPHHNASMFIYNQLNCTLKGVTCPGYITTQGARNRMENFGVFDECQKYSAPDIFTCNPGDKMYKLQYCNSGFYSGISDIPEFAGSERCYFCPSGYYTNGTGATAISQCKITCPAGKYVATANQQCVSCPTGMQSSEHTVSGGSTSSCIACNNKPAHSHYVGASTNSDCIWACDAGYYKNGNVCTACPTGTWSADGAEGENSCNQCTNAPENSTYTNKGTYNNCPWDCNIGYYPSTETVTRYVIDDPVLWNLPSIVFGNCSTNNIGNLICKQPVAGVEGLIGRSIQVDICAACTNKPDHSTYTSNGTDNNCNFDCDAGYYKDYGVLIFDFNNCVDGMCLVTGLRQTSANGTINILKGNDLGNELSTRGGCTNGYCPAPPPTCTVCPEGYTSDQGAVGADACYEEAKCSSISYLPDCGTNQSCPSIPNSDLCDVGVATITQNGGNYCGNGSCTARPRKYTCTNYNSVVSCFNYPAATCSAPDGSIVAHGMNKTVYNASSVSCPNNCGSETKVCDNGYWYDISTEPLLHITCNPLFGPCYTYYGVDNRVSIPSNFTNGYTHSSCTRQGTSSSCNTSYYNQENHYNAAYNGYETCTYYDDTCTSRKRYHITSCEGGYHLYDGACKPNPTCGTANNKTYSSQPSNSLLCGNGSSLEGNVTGTWDWTCGRYDATISCHASKSSGGGRTPGDGGTQTCFLAGTPVLTPDGSKNIEDIEEGDLVLSYDPATQEYEYNEVLKKFVHENSTDDVYTLTIDGNKLDVTELHAFYVVGEAEWPYQCHLPYEWVAANKLRVGDKLLMSDGSYATIENITHRPNRSTTYNLNVENAHTYFVGEGYLVHNMMLTKDQRNRWESAGGNESQYWYANDCDTNPAGCPPGLNRWTGWL